MRERIMNIMNTMSTLPLFKSLGMNPDKEPEITEGMQPITTMVTPMRRDLRLGETSSKANSWMMGLTKISPMPVTQNGMNVHHADTSDMATPLAAHCDTSNQSPPSPSHPALVSTDLSQLSSTAQKHVSPDSASH